MRVELLLAPDCPNAAAARRLVGNCLAQLDLTVAIVERTGDYPSPTVLVDGTDVMTDRQGAPRGQACRLDLPTTPRLLAALRGALR